MYFTWCAIDETRLKWINNEQAIHSVTFMAYKYLIKYRTWLKSGKLYIKIKNS